MYKIIVFFSFFLLSVGLSAQVVINELDCDTPGIDDKEFVELKSLIPNFSLDGYVVVFFNGSANGGNLSYLALDLDGYTTDVNGIFLIGSTTVIPFPQYMIPVNVIQNGADAVAIYKNDEVNFPIGTLAFVDNTLVDVLVYGTSDPDPISTLDIFKTFNPNVKLINEGGGNNTNSIARNNDGSYIAGVPTPRKPNDGSGIVLNGLLTTFNKTKYLEGESIAITFTTESIVNEDLTIDFTLTNGSFTNADVNGLLKVTIAKGKNTSTANFILVDDNNDEGDEEMLVKLAPLPNIYLVVNNSIIIRIEDNDYKIADFGTPLQPTKGKVTSTEPQGYYKNINGLAGNALRQALQDIIANPSVVRAQTYNDAINMLKEADQNPANSNQVWLVYSEKPRSKFDFQITSDNFNTWNREHTWPRSRGGFDNRIGDDAFDGKNIYWESNADSTRHANSDGHGLRAEDSQENSSRGNQFYGEYNGPLDNKGSFKGDVARGIFYLDLRYNGLEVVNGFPETEVGKFGDLATLLEWHKNDPPDDFEMNRNNVVYTWQYNRNPFIDMPELVDYFWGDKINAQWNNTSNTDQQPSSPFAIFPNPTTQKIFIKGINDKVVIELYNDIGSLVYSLQTNTDTIIDRPMPKGIYLLKIKSSSKNYTECIVIE